MKFICLTKHPEETMTIKVKDLIKILEDCDEQVECVSYTLNNFPSDRSKTAKEKI